MAGTKVKWTDSQIQAIETTDADVLVTASAGTGKTAVLSERCAQLLADTKLANASEIVVLTFTEAAAEEMLSRIAETLRKKFLQSRDTAIRHQLLLLDAAHISTIHAFCKRIITENFHTGGVDPEFRIIDEDERALLKSQILDEVIEQAWADDALSQGLDKLLYRRNIQSTGKNFLKTIIEASTFLDSVASADDFFERAQILAEAASLSVNALAKKQQQIILEKLQQCKSQIEYSMVLDAKATEGGHWAGLLVDGLLGPINKCIGAIEEGDFETCAKVIREFSWKRFTVKPKHLSKDQADAIKAPAAKAKDAIKGLKDLAIVCERYDEVVGVSAGLQTKVLIELVKRFDRKYRDAKKGFNCLDFADLEHKALKLLNENAAVAQSLQRKFKYIFVDEYQDINAVQQAILNKIQRGDNTFVVGDAKQSIYAFRQAKPGIFLDRLKTADGGTGAPLRVDLSDNFRSRKPVLDFMNMVFAKIMTEGLSSIEYDQRSYLKAGFEYEPAEKDAKFVEMYILDEEVSEKTEDNEKNIRFKGQVSAGQRQASFIAKRIKRMVGEAEFKIYDKDADVYRPVEHRDIVILMRSPSNRAAEYVEVFELAGIPVSSQNCSGYFEATEISDCLCLMKVLDNPRRDIELAAVLRSPFFRVTDTELAVIRKFGDSAQSKPSFYDRMTLYCERGNDEGLRDKLCGISEQLNMWRRLVRRGSIADALWQVLRDTGYLSFVSALPNGKQRRANLLKMHDRAIQFEGFAGVAANQSTSLGRFVEFIEKLLAHDKDWAPAEPETSAQNAVRIMSVHKSKGLEFPVVFLAELNNKFNKKDSTNDCLFDADDTFGLKIVEPNLKVKLSSIAHQVIAEEKLKTTLAEEMRVLYVAMTRARERLIITASKEKDRCRKLVTEAAMIEGDGLRNWQLRDCQCHFDWILCGLSDQRKLQSALDIETDGNSNDSGKLFNANIVSREKLDEIASSLLRRESDDIKDKRVTGGNAKKALAKIKESLNWRYAFEDLTCMSTKTSVSQLTHREDEFATTVSADALKRMPQAVDRQAHGKISASQRGTATHLVIQNLDLAQAVSLETVQEVIAKLVSDGAIPEAVAAQIDVSAIERFFASELGKQCFAQGNTVLREWPFTFGVDAKELGARTSGENVIVQGIVDMIIKTPAGLVVIDFKTDNVTTTAALDRAGRYRGQMSHYVRAAGAVLGENVAGAYLYFLLPGTAVRTENPV